MKATIKFRRLSRVNCLPPVTVLNLTPENASDKRALSRFAEKRCALDPTTKKGEQYLVLMWDEHGPDRHPTSVHYHG